MKKQRLLLMFLPLTLLLAGTSVKVVAQTPEPDGQWTFENTSDLMAASKGTMTMTPAIAGAKSITLSTVGEANIQAAAGPEDGNGAIKVPRTSALKIARAEGAEASATYTFMLDMKVLDAVNYNGLLQTSESNSNDGDLFIYKNQIGMNAMGGYFGKIKDDTWYRIVMTNTGSAVKVYVDGVKVIDYATTDLRWELDPWGFYLLCDEDNEMVDTYVSEVAFWETPLTDEQVSEMGSAVPPVPNEVFEIATPEDLNTFAGLVESGMEVDGKLTADINLAESDYPDLMIGSESSRFSGLFDGQGHTITYHYEGDCLADKWRGLFASVDGATIRNLRVEGEAFPTNIHYGALIGVAYGDVLVENVVTNVHITGVHSGVTGDAGMLGANYAHITFNNCATLGEMGNPGSSMYSSYSGWSNGSSSTTLNNCYSACSITEGTTIDGNSGTLTHGGGTNTFNNCYYLNYIDKAQGTQVTKEQMASGSLCYKLNLGQDVVLSVIPWTQNIGVDEFPMPDPDGPRVYGSGTLRCDGAELEDNPLTYSNTVSYPVIPDHQFGTDGICTVCGMTDPNAVKQNEEGFYLIGNPEQMYWLYLKVQESDADLKVLLTDDIDLTEGNDPSLMIGTENRPFRGIFDGGTHTIHYDYDMVTEKWRGLFAFVKDATIRNLRVEGTVYVTNIHYGALIGRGDGTILVENVVTDVDILGARSGVTGDAGMIGANYANITFTNCATLGEMGFEGSSMYSPFSGWSEASSRTTLNNCYSTCKLTEGTGTGNCFTLTHQNGNVTINNSYYLNVIGRVLSGSQIHQAQITDEQLESGELCYMLNGDQSSIGWYQTLGDDELPVPFDSHLKVYGVGETYMNIADDADFRSFVEAVIEGEKEYYEELKTQRSLADAYLEALEGLEGSPDIESFLAAYNGLAEQRQAVLSCAEAYAAYIARVEETKQYLEEHPDLDNEKADMLKAYLTEYNEEPSEAYPNGSAEYILDKCQLSEEEITSETALVAERLVEAITYTPGFAEVTLLLTNADLSDGFNGWEGKVGTGTGGSETSPLYAAECLATTMDMHQTLTGLKNGIYELQVNGAFRPTPYDNFYNTNYAATLYANGVHNYFQANIEDMISPEDAVDGVNCNITGPIADFAVPDEDGELAGYTMQGIVSCCNAFQAGRYPNSVLCNVTDGTLTVGIRQPGTGQSRDWLGFGNIRLFYYGELGEAGESLDHVLASQSARAHTILYNYTYDITDDYALYPNFSQALKDELQQTLDAVEGTAEPEAKYQLIEKFSSLFLQIYECKQAYITLMDKAEEVSNLLDAFSSILTEDEFLQMEDLYAYLVNGYADGTLSAEEALAVDPKAAINFFPEEEDGYYLLGSPKDFFVFASLVGAGSTGINAKLVADIDLRESDFPNVMIGNSGAQFSGTFDGQGHTVAYSYTVDDNYGGLFAYLSNGATIRNLRVEGDAVVTAIHFGALMGRVDNNSSVLVENVITNVNIVGQRSGVTGDAGMVGALYGKVTFNNCATLGAMGCEGSSMYCGFTAWASDNGLSTLNNCYTACSLTEGTGLDYCYTFCRGAFNLKNCYYLNAIGTKQGTAMTEEQFRSGEVCYKLNGDQSVISWYQTIGEDAFPVLDESHQIVVFEDGKYDNPDGIQEIKSEELRMKNDRGVYDLQGRQISAEADSSLFTLHSSLKKGVYIVGGKKILVK